MSRKNYSEEFRRQAVELYESTPGATIRGIAADLGVVRGTQTDWIDQYGTGTKTHVDGTRMNTPTRPHRQQSTSPDLPETVEQKLARLEAENAALRAETTKLTTEREILRKAAKYFGRGDELVTRFQFVADHSDTYQVKRLCELVELERSSYYAWKAAEPDRAARAEDDAQLADRIRAIHTQDNTYGAPRITAELNDGIAADEKINHKRVARVMRENSIVGYRRRRRVTTTVPEPADQKVPDLLERDFTADAPNRIYVGDITYLPLEDGANLYLATVIDCYSRKLVGWAIADHMRTDLVADALHAAAQARHGLTEAVFHSDHGSQYTSKEFAALCARFGVIQSMGKVGTSADNSLAESFNAALKREVLQDANAWPDEATCRRQVFRWVTRYNTRRRHSWCGHRSPNTYENLYIATLASAA
ncbi:IS3 family transposase [Rhodococcus pyridinivorans]|uniref:IS3 family transposase n=1 Tax=Rhodococcus pyridinivorans TaxID=103816 RepID=UPI001E3391EE|nr:IS3 family transposase [Rhodococcus pyridinivorans]MCD5422501.1 IS3 family transposase [Rhodococcus pyridinivorans]